VGAVIVRDGSVVGQGYHAKAGDPHAEIVALKDAGDKALGATVYVTLEPCCFRGRTGPCTEALLEAGVARVVAAMADPNPLVSGKGFRQLRERGVEVTVGVLEEEARRLNEVFIKYVTTGLPFVVAKVAMSLDGKIATSLGHSQWITGPEARAYVHVLRDRYDGIMVGRGTLEADNPSLTTRLEQGEGKDPIRIVLDSGANTPTEANVLTIDSPASAIIAVTASADRRKREALEKAGAKVLVVNEGAQIDLARLMKLLGEMGITSLLLEGGAQVHGSAFAAGIVDKVDWFIAPRIIGGITAPGPIGGKGFGLLADTPRLEGETVTRFGGDICIEGSVLHRHSGQATVVQ
jgi:diaminohydroxyphosphoribosylaminopyrimidine deaminase/5-amino-6-(5-phosphoribosylamino)uracil reductase